MKKIAFHCLIKITVSLIILVSSYQNNLVAQSYLGIGWHLGMPAKFDNCCVPFFQANSFPTSSFSLTYKKEIVTKSKRKWYYEMGFTTAGMGYNEVEHDNDTITSENLPPWGIFKVTKRGLASLLVGGGYNIPLKNGHEFVLGLEGSFRLTNSLGGFGSDDFILFTPDKIKYPIFLRANIGYAIPLKLLKQIPSHLLFYTKLSAQNIAEGAQYITDSSTGITNRDGKYRLNNSEVGIQFYLNINKAHYNFLDNPPKDRKPRAKRTGKTKLKLSLEQQFFSTRPAQYYMPQVDSFSLNGTAIVPTAQISLKAEFAHFKNSNWSTVVAFGTGHVNEWRRFSAPASFVPGGKAIEPTVDGGPIGRYLIQNIGLSYSHNWGQRRKIQHTLTACAVEPVEKYATGYMFFAVANFQNPILSGEFYEKYSHSKVAFGLEYSPEILLHTHKRVYFGFGLVLNYTHGEMAIGRATVSNGRTTYYGGMIQRFSKIGFTARMGFQGRNSALGL